MSDQYLIAYDIGTSGTKASLYSADGRMLHRCTVGYEISYRSGGRVEQYPDDWWNAVVTATRKLTENADGRAVAAVSFSGQMMGCLLIDRDGKPLGNSIIWADTRAQDEAEILSKRVGEERGYQILGHRISCSYSIEKLMWLKKNEPERYEQGFKMIQAKLVGSADHRPCLRFILQLRQLHGAVSYTGYFFTAHHVGSARSVVL